jgi:carbamoyltransferase
MTTGDLFGGNQFDRDKEMLVLGIHKDPWHNTGAALVRSDAGHTEVVMVSEERLDRVKDSRSYPDRSIKACLKEFGLTGLDQVDLVVMDYIHDKDWRRDHFKTPCQTVLELEKLSAEKIHVMNHHLAHAAAVFYSSGFASSAVLVVDGRGSENETQSLFVADASGIRHVASTKTIGIGLLYAAVTQAVGFKLLQEGKTMGLAPFGAAVQPPVFKFERKFDGIVTDYSSSCVEGSYDMAIPYRSLETFDDKARAAYDVQQECEAAMLHLAHWAKTVTGLEHLCISGGVGLNSVANYKILETKLYKDVFVNPAASDTGIPLGAALYGLHDVLGVERNHAGIGAFVGPTYSASEVEAAIAASTGYRVVRKDVVDLAVEMLASDQIVACHYGRSEMGPRALGHRSIFMSPLKAENKDILNARVKHRESFRPFAPVILEERVSEYFDMDRPCPYMLFVPMVRPEKRSVIPAVTHVDGSGRLQTVTRERNPHFYSIIEKFGKRTGVPVILNTSFNDNNEPIVESPEDAIRCFMGTNIDALLIGEETLLIKE